MGTYTCKDCKVQCMERSREYICTSFTVIDSTGEPNKAGVSDKQINYTTKSKGSKTSGEKV